MSREPDPDWILQRRRAIGDRVRSGREDADLTQEELSYQAGVTRLTIQRIESGATDARIGWLLRIARRLGVPLRDLLEDWPEPGRPAGSTALDGRETRMDMPGEY